MIWKRASCSYAISQVIYQGQNRKATRWCNARLAQLDEGKVEALLRCLRRLQPSSKKAQEELRRTINYFAHNRERMRYGEYRQQGWFVGSGVVEAGCRTVVGQRLKQSGMHWSLRGANAITALRCIQLSGVWRSSGKCVPRDSIRVPTNLSHTLLRVADIFAGVPNQQCPF